MSSRYERMLEAIVNGEQITEEPICRREMFLKTLANKEGASNLPEPKSREEKYYKAIIDGETITDEPTCKREEFLKALANGEEIPECSTLNCREEQLLQQVCACKLGGGGTPTPTTYTVTFSNGVKVLKGSTSITSGTKVTKDTVLTISYTLSAGHHLSYFKVNGVDTANNSTITVTGNVNITFAEVLNSYSITFNDGVTVLKNGTDKVTSGNVVLYGTQLTISYTLTDGYKLSKFQVNGTDVDNNTTIIVTENINITFAQEQEIVMHTVTFDSGVTVLNGSIQLTSGDSVEYGTILTIGYTLTEHYHLTEFKVNDVDAVNNSTITITSDVNITFAQAIDTYAITFGEGVSVLNGGTSLASGDMVAYGTSLVVRYTLTDGYELTAFQVNGVDTENNSSITVTGNINIIFEQTETSSSGGGSSATFSRTFSENTPEQISAVSAEISANNMTSAQVAETYGWNLGDTVNITLTTGEAIQMRIIGFNHDDKSDGSGKAGITLDMVGVLNTTYQMNNTNTSEGGWRSCNLRTSIFPTIKATLPSEWQNIIKMVNKKSAYDGTLDTIVTSSDHLFLLAEIEVHGENVYGSPDEGVVYEYWNGKDSTAKKKTYQWWSRGPRKSSSNKYFCCVVNGNAGQYLANQTNVSVSFAFCV